MSNFRKNFSACNFFQPSSIGLNLPNYAKQYSHNPSNATCLWRSTCLNLTVTIWACHIHLQKKGFWLYLCFRDEKVRKWNYWASSKLNCIHNNCLSRCWDLVHYCYMLWSWWWLCMYFWRLHESPCCKEKNYWLFLMQKIWAFKRGAWPFIIWVCEYVQPKKVQKSLLVHNVL